MRKAPVTLAIWCLRLPMIEIIATRPTVWMTTVAIAIRLATTSAMIMTDLLTARRLRAFAGFTLTLIGLGVKVQITRFPRIAP